MEIFQRYEYLSVVTFLSLIIIIRKLIINNSINQRTFKQSDKILLYSKVLATTGNIACLIFIR